MPPGVGYAGMSKAMDKMSAGDHILSFFTGEKVKGLDKAFAKAPLRVGGGLGLGAMWAWDLSKPLRQAAFGQQEARTRRHQMMEAERESIFQQRLMDIERRQLERTMMQNAARLAAVNPQLYNEVMAGQRLPQDAVVLGGSPRVDLLEQLAMSMSQNEFEQPPSPEDELMTLLGG